MIAPGDLALLVVSTVLPSVPALLAWAVGAIAALVLLRRQPVAAILVVFAAVLAWASVAASVAGQLFWIWSVMSGGSGAAPGTAVSGVRMLVGSLMDSLAWILVIVATHAWRPGQDR